MQEDEPKDDEHDEAQDVEMEPTQPLLKDWRYATNHLNELIISDVSKGVNNIYGHFAFISHIEPKNILKVEGDLYRLLAM